MKQKTLNKMHKYCKAHGWRFGQLISNLSGPSNDPFYLTDDYLERKFNILWNQDKPKKKTGGYYPKGHTNVSVAVSRPARTPAA